MAAYAALVSALNIIDQIKHHPCPPISLDEQAAKSLTEKLTFLKEFLEGLSHVPSYSKVADPLERQIADAAIAAEDIIESHIMDIFRARSKGLHRKISIDEDLQKVMEEMDSIMKDVMEIKEKMGVVDKVERNSTYVGYTLSSSAMQNAMVGSNDDVMFEVLDKLTGGQHNRQVIPIVGMGGIGKTTLARKIHENKEIVQYFDILVWVTISQEYKIREILLQLLEEGREDLDEYELGDKLHKKLSNRRYLIIMDDIWDVDVWDQVNLYLPDNNNGSRVMLTTRLSNLATQVADSRGRINMAFLDEESSWNLFSKIVFVEEGCPIDLEIIGKKIVESCRGLPLSIVVIGGLLAKSKRTQEYWEYIAENLNSIVNAEDDENCLKLLHTSYSELPVYLKPCFLYMGVFPEDSNIHVSSIIKLWVAEGFLEPIGSKSLEEVAEEYLNDLIARNLILVRRKGSAGKIKECNIHDLLRDLCIKQARKEKFLCVKMAHNTDLRICISSRCRICIRGRKSFKSRIYRYLLSLVKKPVSLVMNSKYLAGLGGVLVWHKYRIWHTGIHQSPLVRYYETKYRKLHLEPVFQVVNLRYIYLDSPGSIDGIPPKIYCLWNLQTLIVENLWKNTAPTKIWTMTQLRHVEVDELYLPDPPTTDDYVMWNLQTLSTIKNFRFTEEVVRRIPNIKRLRIRSEEYAGGSHHCLNNLGRLHKLEFLDCWIYSKELPSHGDLLQNASFPHSIRKLNLRGCLLDSEDMTTKIGVLPLLEALKLNFRSFKGTTWETVEGQFCNLKSLQLEDCDDLQYWITDSSHLPRLERLVLRRLCELEEIPFCIGEIPTLRSIEVECCSNSVVISAKEILKEQEELGNVDLRVRVELLRQDYKKLAAAGISASCNFLVEIICDRYIEDGDDSLISAVGNSTSCNSEMEISNN